MSHSSAYTIYNSDHLRNISGERLHEQRIGQQLAARRRDRQDIDTFLSDNKDQFIVLGIPEDIGIAANGGIRGSRYCWENSLGFLLRAQVNSFSKNLDFTVLGEVNCKELLANYDSLGSAPKAEDIFKLVDELDSIVYELIRKIVSAGRIPIIVGGGHNNAYPIIKGTAIGRIDRDGAVNKSIHSINIDTHADLRPMEGRHSGNGFTYALHEGYLDKYYILGLQESYITEGIEHILKELKNRVSYSSFEDLIIRQTTKKEEVISSYKSIIKNHSSGLELDMDCISAMPSSAYSPIGFSTSEVLQMIHQIAASYKPLYFHITEGAIAKDSINDKEFLRQQRSFSGKAVASFILEFIKSY